MSFKIDSFQQTVQAFETERTRNVEKEEKSERVEDGIKELQITFSCSEHNVPEFSLSTKTQTVQITKQSGTARVIE